MKIVPMKKKHLPEVVEVLADAFTEWRINKRGKDAPKRLRREECILPYIQLEPEGCLVAIDKGKIVGAIFSHVWGKTGWIGTFGVLPEYQSKGVGKELMVKAINYLDKVRNVTKLALETMPDSVKNIALYSKLGFRPAFHTMSLTKELIFTKEHQKQLDDLSKNMNIKMKFYSQIENKSEALNRIQWLSSKIENGLDFTCELEIIDNENFGETILLTKDDFIIAIATCRTASRHQDIEDDYLDVRFILQDLDEKDKEILDILLLAAEQYGSINNKKDIRLRINSSYWVAFDYLLNEKQFNLRGSLLRMIKFSEDIKAFDHHYEWIILGHGYTM